jgi:hypothetical protein
MKINENVFVLFYVTVRNLIKAYSFNINGLLFLQIIPTLYITWFDNW